MKKGRKLTKKKADKKEKLKEIESKLEKETNEETKEESEITDELNEAIFEDFSFPSSILTERGIISLDQVAAGSQLTPIRIERGQFADSRNLINEGEVKYDSSPQRYDSNKRNYSAANSPIIYDSTLIREASYISGTNLNESSFRNNKRDTFINENLADPFLNREGIIRREPDRANLSEDINTKSFKSEVFRDSRLTKSKDYYTT